jgi:predicted esterase
MTIENLTLQPQFIDVPVTVPVSFLHLNLGPDKPLLILFHGFQDSAASLLRRVKPALSDGFEILAINGLFPVPRYKDGVWKEAYAWYFFDMNKNTMVIPPDGAILSVQAVLKKLDLMNRPKVLLGFSQGGFFMPRVAEKLTHIQALIGIGTGYQIEDYKQSAIDAPVFSVHGDQDEVISIKGAQEQFKRVQDAIPGSLWTSVPKMTHALNEDGTRAIKVILEKFI